MENPDHMWFLLGMKPGEMPLKVLVVDWSSKCPELATEHEPKALAVLKKRLPKDENIEGIRFHAARLMLYGDDHLSRIHFEKESKRWRGEFQRFLARCGMTLVEQKDVMREFGEMLITTFKENRDKAAEITPLSQSLWGKSKTK